jgi:hypothetical protein
MSHEQFQNFNLNRVYRINYDSISGFVPGRNSDGEQILMGVLTKEVLIAIIFSPEGRYLRHTFFPVPWNPDPTLLPGQQENRHAQTLKDAKRKWMDELAMTPGDILIRHFILPEFGIGTAEWPLAYCHEAQRVMATGESFEDELLAEWQQQQRWVMHWNKEYWMTADGEIGDT